MVVGHPRAGWEEGLKRSVDAAQVPGRGPRPRPVVGNRGRRCARLTASIEDGQPRCQALLPQLVHLLSDVWRVDVVDEHRVHLVQRRAGQVRGPNGKGDGGAHRVVDDDDASVRQLLQSRHDPRATGTGDVDGLHAPRLRRRGRSRRPSLQVP